MVDYIVGCDICDADQYNYILARKVVNITDILLNKSCWISDKEDIDKFEIDINKLVEYFNCEIYRDNNKKLQ